MQFHVPNISCGHCVRAITEAVREVDSQAQVKVDIRAKTVDVVTTVERPMLANALAEAGYQPD